MPALGVIVTDDHPLVRAGRYIGPELAEGRSVSEIAARLCLSVKTASTCRSRVLDKLDMKINAAITSYAIRNRIIQ